LAVLDEKAGVRQMCPGVSCSRCESTLPSALVSSLEKQIPLMSSFTHAGPEAAADTLETTEKLILDQILEQLGSFMGDR